MKAISKHYIFGSTNKYHSLSQTGSPSKGKKRVSLVDQKLEKELQVKQTQLKTLQEKIHSISKKLLYKSDENLKQQKESLREEYESLTAEVDNLQKTILKTIQEVYIHDTYLKRHIKS